MTDLSQRLQGIDAFRVYAMALIVCAHVQFFGETHWGSITDVLTLVIVVLARYTMPFFFMVSGYFVGAKIIAAPSEAITIARRYTRKLLLVFAFWCVVYGLEDPMGSVRLAIHHPTKLILEGTKVHLWFLVSLATTIWLFGLMPFGKTVRNFLLLGGVLYVIALLGGSYKVTALGFDPHIDTRDGFFSGALFFAMGAWFHERRPRMEKGGAMVLAILGFATFCVEAYFLSSRYAVRPIDNDFLIGSVPWGAGVFLLAVSSGESWIDARVGPLGKYVLGVYVSHLLFLDLLRPLGSMFPPFAWQLLYPSLIVGLSLLTISILSRTRLRTVVL